MEVPSTAAGMVKRSQGQGWRRGFRGERGCGDRDAGRCGAAARRRAKAARSAGWGRIGRRRRSARVPGREPRPPAAAARRAPAPAPKAAAASGRKADIECQVVRARLRPGRLHGGIPRCRPGPGHGADRALRHARRRLPERRLHPVQGAAARGQGDRRGQRTSPIIGITFGKPKIDLDKLAALQGQGRRATDRRSRRHGQAAQGQGRAAAPASSYRRTKSKSTARTARSSCASRSASSPPARRR